MKKFLLFVFIVLIVEMAILIGISVYFETNLFNTMFFGSCVFVFIALLMSSSGDALSRASEVKAFTTSMGSYKPKFEEGSFRFNPFVVGSLLCLITYFGVFYIWGT
ncbi:hypothetical protein [Sutcliffiella rhizosphaerae]|uniref:DUF3899 domain-containing protein n=1 Tax=Sutcliffiella rhizosphaerae TaxID=2880967 RepID=A0ABN8A8Q0_9BACI|nr:hypothetical protein [Sutcliffiella rhizosphaerae]CAG9621510.1 hypothetical protein BACCIP111883_02283 [Sutcliffiella rhizosphaerae]